MELDALRDLDSLLGLGRLPDIGLLRDYDPSSAGLDPALPLNVVRGLFFDLERELPLDLGLECRLTSVSC